MFTYKKCKSSKPKVASKDTRDNEKAIQNLCKSGAGEECRDANCFQFYIISKGRPSNVPIMQSHFSDKGPQPIWIVGVGETQDYKSAGAKNVIEVTHSLSKSHIVILFKHTHLPFSSLSSQLSLLLMLCFFC
jgi:hypothetical protein